MVKYREYPEPVIAAYLRSVRSLPVEHDPEDLLSATRARIGSGSLRRRVVDLVAVGVLTGCAWLTLRSSTVTVSDVQANAVYRDLWRELKRRGWDLTARQNVAYGLNALRYRDIAGECAERLYSGTMERRIPRSSIGWQSSP